MTNKAVKLMTAPTRTRVISARLQTAAMIPGVGTEQTLLAERFPRGSQIYFDEGSTYLTIEINETFPVTRIPLMNVVAFTTEAG